MQVAKHYSKFWTLFWLQLGQSTNPWGCLCRMSTKLGVSKINMACDVLNKCHYLFNLSNCPIWRYWHSTSWKSRDWSLEAWYAGELLPCKLIGRGQDHRNASPRHPNSVPWTQYWLQHQECFCEAPQTWWCGRECPQWPTLWCVKFYCTGNVKQSNGVDLYLTAWFCTRGSFLPGDHP